MLLSSVIASIMFKHRVVPLQWPLNRSWQHLFNGLGLRSWSRFWLALVLSFGVALGAAIALPAPELVDIQAIAPTIQLDLRYATTNNFTGQKLYAQARCLLRPQVATRLALVQADLEAKQLGLKVFDCYRPLSVQKRMWELVPDANYVADPKSGSRHNRGSAVDLTLVDRQGHALPMPSEFDEFSPRSHLDYQGGTPTTRQNRDLLQTAMLKRGFTSIPTEWWHFDAPNWQSYPLLDIPLSAGNAWH